MVNINLKCQCGQVKGTVSDVSPSSGIRVVCCCASCQEFAKYLGKQSDVLDEFGGTEIFQVSQSQIKIHRGQEKLQGMRLTPKGLLRWHTTCCNTPVGNTVSAKLPFVGVIHTFMDMENTEDTLGQVRAYVQTQDATKTPGYAKHSAKFPLGITLQGKSKPSPFFNEEGLPVVKPIVLGN